VTWLRRPTADAAPARARDAALRRLSTLNRLAAAGSAALVLGFTSLAAHATAAHPSGRGRTATGGTDAGRVRRAAPGVHRRHHHRHQRRRAAPSAPITTAPPPPTSQPPVVVSGGS
jgi:hypothetical protein